jgi:hypothetical protein
LQELQSLQPLSLSSLVFPFRFGGLITFNCFTVKKFEDLNRAKMSPWWLNCGSSRKIARKPVLKKKSLKRRTGLGGA